MVLSKIDNAFIRILREREAGKQPCFLFRGAERKGARAMGKIVSDESIPNEKVGLVKVLSNIRKEPSLDAEIVRTATAGEQVKILEKSGIFYKIPNGYIKQDLVRTEGYGKNKLLFDMRNEIK